MPKQYGYIRVGALVEAGITQNQLFMDKQSGKDFDRPNIRKSCASSNRAIH